MSNKATWPNDDVNSKLQIAMERRLSWLQTRARLLAFVWVILLVEALELLLLERKYDLFTGGFLQPHSFLNLKERAVFLGLSLWMDAFLYGCAALLWFRLASRWKVRPLVAAYNFAFLMSAAIGGWLAIKFKVLSYFNDTLNFQIIQNLGGGSLYEALAYIANEAVIIGLVAVIAVTAYWLGLLRLRQAETSDHSSPAKRRFSMWALLTAIIVTAGFAHWISSDSLLRYGLQKKISYTVIMTALNKITDIDLDGFGSFSFPKDHAPFDPQIYPGALDRPENGVDEDGYGGDFQWHGSETDPLGNLLPHTGDHIVVIVLESARGDLLGKTVDGREAAPFMSAIARRGSSAKYAYSHTGYTTSSIIAILNRTLSARPDRFTLIEYLKQSGYQLSFLSGQDESFGAVDSTTGMSDPDNYVFDARSALQDRVFPSTAPGSLRLSENRMVEQFITRSGELNWDRPQFFYVNLQAAHFPYHYPTMPAILNERPIPRPDINASNRKWVEATYWNSIAVADRAVGQIVDRLKTLGVLEHTVIMITGDHGESLFDDGFLGHGHALNETQTRIPLIINRPGLDFLCALGLTDLAELLVKAATNRLNNGMCVDSTRPVLQFVGSLDEPQLVGTVSFGEVRTILDPRTRMVFFSDLKRWEHFDAALNDSDLRIRTSELLTLWENKRWQRHLSRKPTPTSSKH